MKVICPDVAAVDAKLKEPGLKENYKKILGDLRRYHERHGNK